MTWSQHKCTARLKSLCTLYSDEFYAMSSIECKRTPYLNYNIFPRIWITLFNCLAWTTTVFLSGIDFIFFFRISFYVTNFWDIIGVFNSQLTGSTRDICHKFLDLYRPVIIIIGRKFLKAFVEVKYETILLSSYNSWSVFDNTNWYLYKNELYS